MLHVQIWIQSVQPRIWSGNSWRLPLLTTSRRHRIYEWSESFACNATERKFQWNTSRRRLHGKNLLSTYSNRPTTNQLKSPQYHSHRTDHNSCVDPSKASRETRQETRQKNNKGTKREALTLSPFTLSIQGEYSTIHVKSNPKFNASPYVQTTTEIATSHHLWRRKR